MEIAFLLGTKIVELTLAVIMGYVLVKSKALTAKDGYRFRAIGLYIINQAVMINAFQIDYTPQILQGLLLSLGMAVFLHALLILLGRILKKLLKLDP